MKDNVEDYPMGPPTCPAHPSHSSMVPVTANSGGFVCITCFELRTDSLESDSHKYHVDQYLSESFKVMYSLFLARKLTDVALRVDCELIHCHKIVLAGASPYFRAMFTSGMRESEMSEIPVYCVSPAIMNKLVHFAYTGEIVIREQNVCELLAAATMFQMSYIVQACCSFLEHQLHPSNSIGICEFATSNGCLELMKSAQAFVDKHFSEVCKHDEFLNLKPCQLMNLIKRDELNVRTEVEVFNAVIRWVNNDKSSRSAALFELLSYVRCHSLPPDFIRGQIKNCSTLDEVPHCREYLQKVLFDLTTHRKCNYKRRTAGCNQVIYSSGGYLRYSLNIFECYNPVTKVWSRLADIPSPRSGLAACCVRSCIYLVGGRNNNEQGNFDAPHMDCYDPMLNSWHVCAPMSVPRNRVAVGVIDDMIYAIGGSANTMHHNTAEKYDPDSDQWTPIASMHYRRIGLGVAVVNRLLYAVGGFDGDQRLCCVERYNPELDCWDAVASMNQRRSGAGVVSVDQHIYAIGGYDSCNQLRTVERYDPERDCWEFVAPMLRPRSALSAAVIDSKIWVFGGYDGIEFLTSVEVYDPIEDHWTEVTTMDFGKSGHAIVVGREPILK